MKYCCDAKGISDESKIIEDEQMRNIADEESEEEDAEERESEDEESDICDSEINEYKKAVHKLLKFRTFKIRNPKSNQQLRCPFCDTEDGYEYTHLLQHAVLVFDDLSERAKQRANHLAMAKYLAFDLANEAEQLPHRSKKILFNLTNEIDMGKKNLDRLQAKFNDRKTSKPRNVIFKEAMNLLCNASSQLKKVLKHQETLNFDSENDYLREELNNALIEEKAKMIDLMREKDDLDVLNQNLLAKERFSNDELQAARKESIKHLSDMPSGSRVVIGIKRMGEIDVKVIKNACKKRLPPEDTDIFAVELCSEWQEKLNDPNWHPFKIVEDDVGKPKRLVREDDDLLKGLKETWGKEIYDAVVAALKEIHEYNPSGCYPVSEMWNFKENRRAKLDEVIDYAFTQVKMDEDSDYDNDYAVTRVKTLKRKRA